MTSFDDRLRALGTEIEWPATPELAAQVLTLIAAEPRGRASRRLRPRSVPALAAAVLAALVLALAAVLAASPDVRADLLRALGLGAVEVRVVDALDLPAAPRSLDLGRRTTLTRARRLGIPILVPTRLGAPDAVYEDASSVTLAYAPRRGLRAVAPGVGAILSAVRADASPYFRKTTRVADAATTFVDVGDSPGLYIAGPHALIVERPDGGGVEALAPRLATSTLVWTTRAGITYRLEADVPRARALAIARSAR